MQPKPLEQIMDTVMRLMPKTPQDVKQNLRAALTDVLNRLDLVTREELDVQEAVLQRTRARLADMEQRIAALEKKDSTETRNGS
jgi:BMFP domain-containing protein YqiC